nr:uncharacterized protein LOC109401945 [Aedes albopictus]XP_029735446.1 uncharacterized protein LOC115270278 [Aedes albopictus]XP_029735448.1 uncharacterized protein LOC109414846 [Aedes albopictus]
MDDEPYGKLAKIEIEEVPETNVIEELDAEGEDADVSYEELDYENDPLVQLLQSFHISAETINKFLANGYDLDGLKIIERQEIEELVGHPNLADRTKLIHGLNIWRKSQKLPPVSTPLAPLETNIQSQSCQSPRSVTKRDELTATFLLQKSTRGKQIIEEFNSTKVLTKAQKRIITHIVIDEFKDSFGKLTHDELLFRACELSNLFPSEPKDSWYQPTFAVDGSKKTRIGRHPKGALYDRNCNYRKGTAQQGGTRQTSDSTTPAAHIFSDDDWMEYQQSKVWMRHHEDEWPAILQRWIATCAYRGLEVSRLESRSCETILDQYPTLRNAEGYQLTQIDFDAKFASKSSALFDNWSKFVSKVKPILTTDVTDKSGKEILLLLDLELNEDCRDAVFTVLIPYILPSSVLTLQNKFKWKPSYVESRNSFVFWVKNITDMQSEVESHHKSRLEKRGLQRCPLVVIIGSELNKLNYFIVSFGDAYYRLPTFLKALDVCYKLFQTYLLEFPPESAGSWNLIGHVIYGSQLNDSNRAKILSINAAFNTEP